ncbi:unnamed protein product [Heterosigma akashiwo]
MSATLNAGTFARYFHRAGVPAVPVVEIPGRAHPVQALYLEDVLERTGYEVDPRGEYAKKKPKGGGGRGGGDPDGPPPRTEKSLEKALPAFSEATRDSLRVGRPPLPSLCPGARGLPLGVSWGTVRSDAAGGVCVWPALGMPWDNARSDAASGVLLMKA